MTTDDAGHAGPAGLDTESAETDQVHAEPKYGPGGIERRRTTRIPVRIPLAIISALLAVLIVVLLYLWAGEEPIEGPAIDGLSPVLVSSGPNTGDRPRFSRPLSAAWSPAGDFYVSDTGNGRICVFNSRGRFEREFGRETSETAESPGDGLLSQPAGLAVAEDGTVYVADLRGGRVVVYNRRGRFLRTLRPAMMPETFAWAPTDVAVGEDRIAVTDAEGVVVFSEEGEFKERIDAVGGATFVRPNGVDFAGDGSLVVSDTNRTRVVGFSAKGELFWTANGRSATSRSIGLPRGLCVAGDGSILVADAFRFAIARLSADGEFLSQHGGQGSGPGRFEYPNDVDERNGLLLVADKENNRVQVLRLVGVLDQ